MDDDVYSSGPHLVDYRVTVPSVGPLRIIPGIRPECLSPGPPPFAPRSSSFAVALVTSPPLCTNNLAYLALLHQRSGPIARSQQPDWSSREEPWSRFIGPLSPVTCTRNLQVIIRELAGQGHGGGLVHLVAVLLEELLVDLGGGRSKGGRGDELLQCEVRITCSTRVELDARHEVCQVACLGGGVGFNHTRAGLPTSLRASQRKGFSKL